MNLYQYEYYESESECLDRFSDLYSTTEDILDDVLMY